MITTESIAPMIHWIRGEKVMLDRDLAQLYGVETHTLKQAVRRNADRFPADFMFELTETELSDLRSQSVISSFAWRAGTVVSQFVTPHRDIHSERADFNEEPAAAKIQENFLGVGV
ncbi:MAG: ORF6N domain-containing protein [Opitutales bacterium]|nr:ORF6N domain-containing protein [Opitutales bacterium]